MTIYSYPGVELTKDNAGVLPWIESDLTKVAKMLTSADAQNAMSGMFRGATDPSTTVNWRENWYAAITKPQLVTFGGLVNNPLVDGSHNVKGILDFIAFCRGVGQEGAGTTVPGWFFMFSGLELAHTLAPAKLYKLDDVTLAVLNTCPALCGSFNGDPYNPLAWLDVMLKTQVTDGSVIETLLATQFRNNHGLGPSGGPA